LATDQQNARSILVYQHNLDKISPLTARTAMGVAGPNCDLVSFTEYIAKNLRLYELSNDYLDNAHHKELSTHAVAHFCRNELATALRRGPAYQVNVLLGGYDDKVGPSLYFMDYLAALQQVPYGAQGYASYFCMGIMDKEYPATKSECTEEHAVNMINQCIHELHTRFMLAQKNFIIKVIDKDGIRTVAQGADPQDN
jgi:20S proteasome alpha/beta subunit